MGIQNTEVTSNFVKVSNNHRYFTKDGNPFIWIGDTAWELFHRLDQEEACEYLTIRARQGFSVIQAVVLAENDGLRTPNPYGEVPLIDLSPEKPNEKYFEHVDFIISKAEALGLQIAILPTWGDKLFSLNPAIGPVVFDAKNAEVYGEFLGKRYKDKPVIWILGGDRNVDNFDVLEIWRSMAKGIKKGDDGLHLMSYHPRGGTSSASWLHNEDWLDFNSYQSGHEKPFNEVYEYALSNYLLSPVKPFVDAEPAYEDIPVAFWEFMNWENGSPTVPDYVLDEDGFLKDKNYFRKGFFTDYDVRVLAYWNLLSGACGYTYGNNSVWQMFKKGMTFNVPCLKDWRDSLDRPGANQMRHVRSLFEVYSISKILPDQSIIYGINTKDSMHIRAACSLDYSFALIYLSQGQPVSVILKKIIEPEIAASWYNPREGTSTYIGRMENTGIKIFTPPSSGYGNDWILVIDASKGIVKE